jgi:hypothetical protein
LNAQERAVEKPLEIGAIVAAPLKNRLKSAKSLPLLAVAARLAAVRN